MATLTDKEIIPVAKEKNKDYGMMYTLVVLLTEVRHTPGFHIARVAVVTSGKLYNRVLNILL